MNKWRQGWRLAVLAGLCGLAMALNQPPFALPIGMVGLIAGFALLGGAETVKRAAFLGWLMGLGYFSVTLHWIVEPFLVDAPRHGWMAPFALLFMAAGLALFWAAAGAFSGLIRPGGLRLLALAASFALAEWLRGTLFTGFAWLPLGFMLTHGSGGAMLAVFGPYGTGMLTTGLAAALVWVGTKPAAWRQRMVPALLLLSLGGLAWGLGVRPSVTQDDAPLIRLVQPNAPQHLKWLPGHRERFFNRAITLSQSMEDERPDLILWPESAIPPWLNHAALEINQISEAAQAPVLAGIRRFEGMRYYNSAVLIDDGAVQAVYDKHHLVPFGEYIPFGKWLSRLGIQGLAAEEGGGYSAGQGAEPTVVPGLGPLQILICYEAVFPEHSRTETRPLALVNLTNDAWFGQWAGPKQHLAHARARALEQGLPMLRAANTGISAVIAPNGEIITEIPLGRAAFTQTTLPAPTQPTLYAATGDRPWIVAMIMLMSAALMLGRSRSD